MATDNWLICSGRLGTGDSDTSSQSGDTEVSIGAGDGSRKSASSSVKDLDTVEEETVDN